MAANNDNHIVDQIDIGNVDMFRVQWQFDQKHHYSI